MHSPLCWPCGPISVVTWCISPHREEYGKLFDFVNAKKLNIKNRGLKEVSLGGEGRATSVLSIEGGGMGLSGFFFLLSLFFLPL